MKQPSILFLCLFLGISLPSFATIRYVTQAGGMTPNGTSWANAFAAASLQTAINDSASGDEVWVACGTYRTTIGTDRNISFSMKNGVTIYGSFLGTETALSQRDISCGPCSMLSGEINVAGIFDNSYHVVSNGNLNNTAIIDGFVVRDGNDNRAATLTNGLGGGFYNNGGFSGNASSPTIRNCVITDNRAVFGGGIFNSGHSGGVSNPLISNCVIAGNTATSGGGGIDNFGLGGNASPTISDCIVYNNTAPVAGGMYCWGGNVGGNANPIVLNCSFVNNSATGGNAGGIIADNLNSPSGGSSGTSNPTVRNSILWGNTATGSGNQFAVLGTATFTATYSDINTTTNQNAPHVISGAGTDNINADPLFLNISSGAGTDGCWMTNDDGLQLTMTTPCDNVGDNSGVSSADLAFNNRIANTTVDLGAYEFNSSPLPVELLRFFGIAEKSSNRLFWTTASERNAYFFEIERSRNGFDFEKIGKLVAVGNAASPSEYSFLDEKLENGFYFYRLRQTDKDGQHQFSPLIFLENAPTPNGFLAFPNPVKDVLTIRFEKETAAEEAFVLRDSKGAILQIVSIEEDSQTLDFSSLPAGIYFLSHAAVWQKIIKMR